MKKLLFILSLFLVLTGVSPATAAEPSADQIIDEALDQNSMGFQSGQARLTLHIEDKAGKKRVRKLEVKSKKIEDRGRTLVMLTAPKEVKGQAFLFAEREGEDDVWMYVPAFKVTRRIEGGQKKGSFLGSHFTYADLESRDIKESTYQKLDDEKIGKHAVYVIEATPKKSADSDYEKVLMYVRKSDYTPLKVKFYEERGGEPSKTLFVEKLDKTSSGQTYAKRMTLRPATGGHTTITIEALDEADIPDATFSKEQLGK